MTTETCKNCSGIGWIGRDKCVRCLGDGAVKAPKKDAHQCAIVDPSPGATEADLEESRVRLCKSCGRDIIGARFEGGPQ